LLPQANTGDPKALAALRAACDADPTVWRDLGDLGRLGRISLIDKIGGKNSVISAAIARRVGALRDELGGPAPPPLERLLIDRILSNWLHLHAAEAVYAQRVGELTLKQSEYHQRTIDRAQRRYLASVKALAEIRRLGLPVVQLNVAAAGGQQVNVA
jgi:hypothetical protein